MFTNDLNLLRKFDVMRQIKKNLRHFKKGIIRAFENKKT